SVDTQFTIPTPDPCENRSAASLIAPADGSTTAGSAIDFSWSAVTKASGYRVWSIIDNGTPQVLGTASANTTLHATIASGHVEWYVETLFDGCASVESAHRTFTVPQAQSCSSS